MDHTPRRFLAAAALLLSACASPPPPAPAAALENTQWRLSEIGGVKALDGAHLTLDAKDVQARGNTGCNNFFGRYELDRGELRFGPMAASRRACAEDERNRQEGAFLKALGDARTWRIAGDTLTLRGESGELARFTVQPRR